MKNNQTIGLLGGDMRQCYMANALVKEGYTVFSYGLDEMVLCDEVIRMQTLEEFMVCTNLIAGPVPFSTDGVEINAKSSKKDLTVENVLMRFPKDGLLFAGCIPEKVLSALGDNRVYDFMKNENIAIFNTIATAEGAIAQAVVHHPGNLHDSECLVLGYGKCAKTLADKLKGLSANVAIAARKEKDLSMAQALGYATVPFHQLQEKIKKYMYIFNTVPAIVLKDEILKNIQDDAIVIDIASMPGGIQYEQAKRCKCKVMHCLSLPGKYAPKASGEALARALLEYIKEE